VSETLEYAQHTPPPALRPYVRCLWTLAGPAPAVRVPQPVVPDGCMEVILNFGDPFERHRVDGSFVERQPLALLVGPTTGPAVIVPTGRIDLVGVRFHPWGAGQLLGLEPAALRDEMPSIGETSCSLARSLELACDARTMPERRSVIERALEQRARRASAPDPALRSVIQAVVTRHAPLSVRELATHVGRSVRWIQRAFERDVGLTPKMLGRIARAQRALRIADRYPSRSWSAVAAEAGYFDHSHLVREFREIVGCTPTELSVRGGELTETFLSAEAPTADR
jgi:AraC-like DNA-binding protein